MKNRKKGFKHARTRDWSDKHEDAFTHDRARHRKADATMAAVQPMRFVPRGSFQPNAVVVSHTGQWAFVQMKGKEYLCEMDQRLGDTRSSVLAPGDDVLIEFPEGTGKPVVRAVATRRSKLSRLAHVHSRLEEQVIAANVDVLVIVASTVQPPFRPGLVDRYLIVAEVGGVTPLLVVNKMDLAPKEPADVQPYRELGVTVLNTSCVTAQGIASLRAALSGKCSVVAGHSGAGKSSLINAMDPSLSIATDEVSASTEKGRHTTTTARLYTLAENIRIIDTPGARSLGLWRVSPEELAYYFPEMAELANGCRFRNCTHVHEPACAVRDAVEAGDLPRQRYASYLRIRASL